MPITFQTDAQRVTHEKLGCFLSELGMPHQLVEDPPLYRLQQDSAQAFVMALPKEDGDTTVVVASRVVQGARVDDPELLAFLTGKNLPGRFGGFSINPAGDIYYRQTMVGSSCSRSQLQSAVVVVLLTSNEADDIICEKWGGKRSLETPAPGTESERGDDPTRRTVHAPTGTGLGDDKAFFFLFGYRAGHATDEGMLARELEHIGDDIEVLRAAGYRVVVDPQATRQDLLDALSAKGEGAEGLAPAAIYWSGHGRTDGAIQTCDGGLVSPEDIDPATVADSLRLMIFSSCYVGHRSRTWRKALGGHPLVVGWGRPVTIGRAVSFLESNAATDTDLDDLIRRYLLAATPIPVEETDARPLGESVVGASVPADTATRLGVVAQMLGARSSREDTHTLFTVPLEGGRSHRVKACVVASTAPYSEGEQLLAVEAEVGELTAIVEPLTLLAAFQSAGYGRVAAIRGPSESPLLVVQGFLPLVRSRDQDLASMLYQVGGQADALELSIFGTDHG